MTAKEFKAWFRGYMEARKEPLSVELKLIAKRIEEIEDGLTVQPTYVPWWSSPTIFSTSIEKTPPLQSN